MHASSFNVDDKTDALKMPLSAVWHKQSEVFTGFIDWT